MDRYTGVTEPETCKLVTGLQYEAVVLKYAELYGVETLQKVVEVIKEAVRRNDQEIELGLVRLRTTLLKTKAFKLLNNPTVREDVLSADASTGEAEEFSLLDLVPDETRPEDTLSYEELVRVIRRFLRAGTLDGRVCKVLSLRLGIDCQPSSLEVVSQQLGLTKERVRQIEERGKAALRAHLERVRAV